MNRRSIIALSVFLVISTIALTLGLVFGLKAGSNSEPKVADNHLKKGVLVDNTPRMTDFISSYGPVKKSIRDLIYQDKLLAMKNLTNVEFTEFIDRIEKKFPFVLTRYGNEEEKLIKGEKIEKSTESFLKGKWSWKENQISKLGVHLKESLKVTDENWLYGFSKDANGKWSPFFADGSISESKIKNVATFFESKRQFESFVKMITYNGIEREVVLVINENLKKEIGLDKAFTAIYSVPTDIVNDFEKHFQGYLAAAENIATKYNGAIILVAAGPYSNVFMKTAWEANPNNQLINCGSLLEDVLNREKELISTFEFSKKFYSDIALPMIYEGNPFAYTRYGDGEALIMRGDKVGKDCQAYTRDKWYWDKDGPGIMSKYLIDSLKYPGGHYYYGIPQKAAFSHYKNYMMDKGASSIPSQYIQNSLLFLDNIELVGVLLEKAFSKQLPTDTVLVINHKHKPKEDIIRQLVKDVFFVGDDLPNLFDDEAKRTKLLKESEDFVKKHKKSLFFVSAGPFSEIFIYQAWKHSPTNQYLDMGSAFDKQFAKYL